MLWDRRETERAVRSLKQETKKKRLLLGARRHVATWLSSVLCFLTSQTCYWAFLSRTKQDTAETSPIPCNYRWNGVSTAFAQKRISVSQSVACDIWYILQRSRDVQKQPTERNKTYTDAQFDVPRFTLVNNHVHTVVKLNVLSDGQLQPASSQSTYLGSILILPFRVSLDLITGFSLKISRVNFVRDSHLRSIKTWTTEPDTSR